MREEILDFNKLVRDYFYIQKQQDEVVFDFIHICFPKENKEVEFHFVPVAISKKFYDIIFKDDINHIKRTIFLKDDIKNYNIDNLVEEHLNMFVPKKYTILTQTDLNEIASFNDYEKIEWEIIRNNYGAMPQSSLNMFWIYKFFGVKKMELKR